MNLQQFFREHPKAALAFSGGVDSAYLLYAAIKYGSQVRAYYVKTAFQPQFELEDALRLVQELGADLKILNRDILSVEAVAENPKNRCYFCKQKIFGTIEAAARADGYPLLLDGTNASDPEADRPGMQALRELGVRSPLREAGLTKAEIRRLSKEAGLFTHDKPAYACLATRVPTGRRITADLLERTERGEEYLKKLGFSDFRIRLLGNSARIQIPETQGQLLWSHRKEIVETLRQDYDGVLLDLEVRGE